MMKMRVFIACLGVMCTAALSGCQIDASAPVENLNAEGQHAFGQDLETDPTLAYECGAASILVHFTSMTLGAMQDETLDIDSYLILESEISKLWQAVYPLGSEVSPTILKIQQASLDGLSPELGNLMESVSVQCGELGAPFQYSGTLGQG